MYVLNLHNMNTLKIKYVRLYWALGLTHQIASFLQMHIDLNLKHHIT